MFCIHHSLQVECGAIGKEMGIDDRTTGHVDSHSQYEHTNKNIAS